MSGGRIVDFFLNNEDGNRFRTASLIGDTEAQTARLTGSIVIEDKYDPRNTPYDPPRVYDTPSHSYASRAGEINYIEYESDCESDGWPSDASLTCSWVSVDGHGSDMEEIGNMEDHLDDYVHDAYIAGGLGSVVSGGLKGAKFLAKKGKGAKGAIAKGKALAGKGKALAEKGQAAVDKAKALKDKAKALKDKGKDKIKSVQGKILKKSNMLRDLRKKAKDKLEALKRVKDVKKRLADHLAKLSVTNKNASADGHDGGKDGKHHSIWKEGAKHFGTVGRMIEHGKGALAAGNEAVEKAKAAKERAGEALGAGEHLVGGLQKLGQRAADKATAIHDKAAKVVGSTPDNSPPPEPAK
jgi:hypothetical protein